MLKFTFHPKWMEYIFQHFCILIISIIVFIIGAIADIAVMIDIPAIIIGIIILFFFILNTYRMIVYGIGKDKFIKKK